MCHVNKRSVAKVLLLSDLFFCRKKKIKQIKLNLYFVFLLHSLGFKVVICGKYINLNKITKKLTYLPET